MKIQALGGCCQKSTKNYENIVAAVKELGLGVTVEHVMDMDAIMALGVMATPGLVIDGKIYASGRMVTVAQAKALIQQAQDLHQESCGCGEESCGCSEKSCGCEDETCDCEDGKCDCKDGQCDCEDGKCDCQDGKCDCESGKCGC